MSKKIRTVKAQAKCQSFDIEIEAKFTPKGLVPDEVDDVRRKLKHQMTEMVAKLPFAHVYPFEVTVR